MLQHAFLALLEKLEVAIKGHHHVWHVLLDITPQTTSFAIHVLLVPSLQHQVSLLVLLVQLVHFKTKFSPYLVPIVLMGS
jgi:glucan phosphorylase